MGRLESLSPFGLTSKPAGSPLRSDEHFRKVLDDLPAAIYVTDAKGRITYFNDAAAALWGCRPELGKSEWCGSWKLYWPDGTPLPHGECPMALSLKEKRPIRGMEAVAERPDGSACIAGELRGAATDGAALGAALADELLGRAGPGFFG